KSVLDLVHFADPLLQPRHRAPGEERDEQLHPEEWRGEGQLSDRGGDEVSVVEGVPAELLAAEHDLALAAGAGHRFPEPLHRRGVDHRPEHDVALRRVPQLQALVRSTSFSTNGWATRWCT